jgi:hypothetical protein
MDLSTRSSDGWVLLSLGHPQIALTMEIKKMQNMVAGGAATIALLMLVSCGPAKQSTVPSVPPQQPTTASSPVSTRQRAAPLTSAVAPSSVSTHASSPAPAAASSPVPNPALCTKMRRLLRQNMRPDDFANALVELGVDIQQPQIDLRCDVDMIYSYGRLLRPTLEITYNKTTTGRSCNISNIDVVGCKLQ